MSGVRTLYVSNDPLHIKKIPYVLLFRNDCRSIRGTLAKSLHFSNSDSRFHHGLIKYVGRDFKPLFRLHMTRVVGLFPQKYI